MNVNEFKRKDWVNVSKGNWSFLSCTDFISCYTKDVTIEGKNPFDHPVQVCKGEKSELWLLQSELDTLGHRIKHINIQEEIDGLVAHVHETGDEALDFIRAANPEQFDSESYRLLWKKMGQYYQYHLVVKYLSEYLSPENFEKFSSLLKNARVQYGEPIFNESETLVRQMIESVGQKSGMRKELLAYLTREELDKYFTADILPAVAALETRYEKSFILGTPEGYTFITGKEADGVEIFLYHAVTSDAQAIKGSPVFKGKATGIVRVILNPKTEALFNAGDILVTGMTHVEYLPLVKKAAAIVTDAGGILSHAAIIARELKKPCIVGTKIATQVLKDGDLVEVDADNGVVRILGK